MLCQRCSEPHHRGGCHRLATAASGGAGVLGTCLHQGRLHDICQLACAAAPSYAGLPAPAHSTCMPHILVCSVVASDHHGCLCLQGMVRRQGPALGQGVQAGAADKPHPAQSGARKRDAGSQQDGAAPRRLNKPGWGSSAGAASLPTAGVCFTCMVRHSQVRHNNYVAVVPDLGSCVGLLHCRLGHSRSCRSVGRPAVRSTATPAFPVVASRGLLAAVQGISSTQNRREQALLEGTMLCNTGFSCGHVQLWTCCALPAVDRRIAAIACSFC